MPQDRAWPDIEPEAETSGLAGVLVARAHSRIGGDATVCGYLVDTYCLGVKDALGPRAMSRNGLHRFVDRFFDGFGRSPVEAPVDLAQHLVWGAVAYARGLGFDPHRDFRPAAGHLGTLAGPSAIGFGRDGKPSTPRARTTMPIGSCGLWRPTWAGTTSISPCRCRCTWGDLRLGACPRKGESARCGVVGAAA